MLLITVFVDVTSVQNTWAYVCLRLHWTQKTVNRVDQAHSLPVYRTTRLRRPGIVAPVEFVCASTVQPGVAICAL